MRPPSAARRRTIGAALALCALAAGWYIASPWWTVWRVREAARDADPKKLSGLVDFEMLTRNERSGHLRFWSQLLDAYSTSSNPDARQQAAMAAERLSHALDISVGPADVKPWLSSIPLDLPTLAGFSGLRGYRPYIVRRGLDAFEVRDRTASYENGPVLTFRRHGLGWRLEGMRYGQQ